MNILGWRRSNLGFRILIVVVLAAFSSLSCQDGRDDEAMAKDLYIEASTLMNEARAGKAPVAAMDRYDQAQAKVDKILNEYPSTDIARQLTDGELGIAGMTLDSFALLGRRCAVLNVARTTPSYCAFLVTYDIENPSDRQRALLNLAEKCRRIEKISFADSVLHAAEESADCIEDQAERVCAVTEVALAFALNGNLVKSTQMLAEIQTVLSQLDRSDEKAKALAFAARAYSRCGESEQALSFVRKIPDAAGKCEVLVEVASSLAMKGQLVDARDTLEDALAIAEDVDGALPRCFTRCSIAREFLAISGSDKALPIGDKALGDARELPADAGGPTSLCRVANLFSECWRTDRATPLIQRALSQVRDLSKNGSRYPVFDIDARIAYYLQDIAGSMAKAGQISSAFDLIQTVDVPRAAARGMASVGVAYLEADSLGMARRVVHHAITEATAIRTPFFQAIALGDICEADVAGVHMVTPEAREQLSQVADRTSWASRVWQ